MAETGTAAAASAAPAAAPSVIGEAREASGGVPIGGSTGDENSEPPPALQAPFPGEGEACVELSGLPAAASVCGRCAGAGGCVAAASKGNGGTPRFWAASCTPKALSGVRPSSVDLHSCCAILASRCEFTAEGLVAATVRPNPFGPNATSIGGGPAGHPAEGVPTGVALSPIESGDDDSLSTSMSSLGAVLLKRPPNVVWKGSECSAQEMRSWRGPSVVSRDVSLPCIGVASGQQSCCPAS